MSLRGEMIEYLRGREREGALSKEAWGEGKVRRACRSSSRGFP